MATKEANGASLFLSSVLPISALVFPVQPWVLSGLSVLSFTSVSCTSLRGEIGNPSDFAWYFLCPAFSLSCIFRSQ